MLYFAYGSNLDEAQMQVRCPSARIEGRAWLFGYALTFGGYSRCWGGAIASLAPARGARVPGLLYRLDKADLLALDRFEGHPYVYERRSAVVLDERGRQRRAQVYVQTEDAFAPCPPRGRYLDVLWGAYVRLGFDPTPLASAAGVWS